MQPLRRRTFFQVTSALAAPLLLPRLALPVSANGKLRTAHIGVGGMQGGSDLAAIASHPKVEVAALCDVDANYLAAAHEQHKNAKTFTDYREMISSLGDSIDAVVITTPDHTHAPAAMTALNAKKPVYCQKPLTHEVFEARQLRVVAEKLGLVTQMGIQARAMTPYRRSIKLIQSGKIGKVSRVYAWSNKNWGYDGPVLRPSPPPKTLDWNLWLGTARERAFSENGYHPHNWRKLIDFGTGTLGDMGVHIFDTPYAALALSAPKWAKTTCRKPTGIGHPEQNIVEYEFPGTQYTTESMLWSWYDGANAPPKLELPDLPADLKLPDQGSLFVGEGGVMLLPHVAEPTIYAKKMVVEYKLEGVEEGNHYHEWVNACMGEGKTSAPFSYGGPLTEALLLGVVANRFPETKLAWNAEALTTDSAEANKLIRREYRKGFEVQGLST